MEQENDKFAVEIHFCKKSAFMMLSFEDRIIKLRNYFKKRRISFPGDVEGKKRDFRRLTKQFSLNQKDNFTILKKMKIT